ncbi:MAG: TrbI/VirB10 family protein [Fusobacterium gastrosuis]|uniref:TrbI/VirB10 family protein n=1 Tax=Fusobacterium TaxID=848 RepID=UPI0025B88532|nr:TrbI/VirB10 family protein [Fusobacterium sp.]MCI7224326.1 TrbI/VirB10 family protein [Fusobacterium sp.]MDY5794714.1 TrbI/VirB10 family protein [Fusobacterium gastrosuis]
MENKDFENKNSPKDLSKKILKKPSVKIKKSFVFATVAVIVSIMAYAFINASIEAKKRETQRNVKEENVKENTAKAQYNLDFLEKDYSNLKREENKRYSEILKNEKTETQLEQDNILGPNIKLEEYYTQLVQEEMQSRFSEIDYSIINKSSKTETLNTEEKDNSKISSTYNKHSLESPKSNYELKAGNFIPAILLSGVDSQIEGNMIGFVRENVYDSVNGKHLLIPKGTKIIGAYNSGVSFGQDRLLIVWQRLIFPNGKSLMLDNFLGVDLSAYAGVKGKVNNHNLELFKSVILSSFLSGATTLVERGKDSKTQNIENAFALGAGERILDIGSALTERILNVKPTITIKAGTRLNVMVNADLILEPYKD